MEIVTQAGPRGMRGAWIEQARVRPWTATGLAVSALAIALLLVSSAWQVLAGAADVSLRLALLGGLAAFGATAVGALPGVALNGVDQRLEDSMLGFAAGMMLAASSFSLILPGLEAGESMTGDGALGAATVVTGMVLGVMLMLGLDQFMPHEHLYVGPCGAGCEQVGRLWLFVFAIALHNLPEGMAIRGLLLTG